MKKALTFSIIGIVIGAILLVAGAAVGGFGAIKWF